MQRVFLWGCGLLLALAAVALAGNETTTDTVQLVRQRLGTVMPGSYMQSGCLPAVPVSATTLAPFACEGVVYAGESSVPVTQAAAAVGALSGGNGVYWIALHTDTSTTVAGWNRQRGTHYLWVKSATKPAMVNSALLAKVTIAGSIITLVEDWRVPSSYVRNGTYEVTDPLYGGVADDSTDVGPAFRAAVAAAEAQLAGPVRLPSGVYKLHSEVVNYKGITIEGDGWGAPEVQLTGNNTQPRRGTWLHLTNTAIVPITITGQGTQLRGIAFDQDHPAPGPGWAPADYPYVIRLVDALGSTIAPSDVVLEHLFFFKVKRAIKQDTLGVLPAGRINIRGIWGQVFDGGIEFVFAADVCRVSDVHFWPYWSQDANVLAYQDTHMFALTSYRVDHLIVNELFAFASNVGIQFLENVHGASQNFMMANLDFDRSHLGLYSNSTLNSGQIVNFNSSAANVSATPFATSSGIVVAGDFTSIDMANVQIFHVGTSCASIGDATSRLTLANIRCNDWNNAGTGHAALRATAGEIMVAGTVVLTTGHTAPNYSGTFTFSAFPGGATFNPGGTFWAGMQSSNPTVNFDTSTYFQWVPGSNAFKLNANAGTYGTGGVKKYLCVQDGVLTVGTTCP